MRIKKTTKSGDVSMVMSVEEVRFLLAILGKMNNSISDIVRKHDPTFSNTMYDPLSEYIDKLDGKSHWRHESYQQFNLEVSKLREGGRVE